MSMCGSEHVLPASAAVICVGNRLMMDEGIGPAVYDELLARYGFPAEVGLHDAGCLGLDMLPVIRDVDFIITVDAVDGTDKTAGTIFEFSTDDMARQTLTTVSLHNMKLADLFDRAALLGYEAEGICYGMQVGNMYPDEYTMHLTDACQASLPLLVESVVAELIRHGFDVTEK